MEEIYEELNENKLLEGNLDFIIQSNLPMQQFCIIAKLLKGRTQEGDKKINDTLKLRKVEFAKLMLKERVDYKKTLMNDYSITLSIMIDELLESEGVSYIDIVKIGRGIYSDVYKIGNKVLKVGEDRGIYNIPNHRRILQPLIRTNFIDEKNGLVIGCIEIADRIKTIPKREQDKEKLYAIYKELRDAGIIWTDVKFENVGILINKNVPTLNGQKMDVAPNSVGFDKKVDEDQTLDSGDWVIIDTDYIYEDTSINIEEQICGYGLEFEYRYKRESASDSDERKKQVEEFVENMKKEDEEVLDK